MNTKIIVESMFNDKKITLETGRLAKLARSSVLVTVEGTSVLVAITSKAGAGDTDFLPLRIDYEEKFYAAGNIGGSRYTRKEGMPSTDAIVNARLIDHAIRPLFAKDYVDETQIVVTVLSVDGKNSPALLAFLGTVAALSISGLPFYGPIIQANIEIHDDHVDVNLDESNHDAKMHLHVAFTKEGSLVQAIEAEGKIVSEKSIFEAIKFGSESVKPLFDLINDFVAKCDVKKVKYVPTWLDTKVLERFKSDFYTKLDGVIEKTGKPLPKNEWDEYFVDVITEATEKYKDEYSESQLRLIFSEIQKLWVRDSVLKNKKRIDGRDFDEIRELTAEVGVIPRVHGSALFDRGVTQALTIATLASTESSLLVQSIDKEVEKYYWHQYNFPPFSTGEVGRVGGINRRAIGHGQLAEKALYPVLPDLEAFPYALRIVSEILSSNGSTSMAATCGSSLALMDAGVPIKSHVAGIGIGLFVDNTDDPKIDDFVVLTDITGTEDFSGYMDYKMTGTRDGVTAIQMELKLKGIPVDLLDKIMQASNVARLKVLDVMDAAISKPRDNISEFAPKVESIKIKKDQIGFIIGSGGATIKGLSAMFDVDINVDEKEDFGLVTIASVNQDALTKAKSYIVDMLREVTEGDIYEGVVTRVEGYGAFVEVLPKQEGLLHVSEFSHSYTADMTGVLEIGDKVKVQVKSLENGKISLSKKSLEEETDEQRQERESRPPRESGGFERRGGGGFERRGGGHDRRTDNNRGQRNDRGGGRDRNSNSGGFYR